MTGSGMFEKGDRSLTACLLLLNVVRSVECLFIMHTIMALGTDVLFMYTICKLRLDSEASRSRLKLHFNIIC